MALVYATEPGSREEDLQHDQYRPASLIKLRAGLDKAGSPVAWHCRVAAPSLKDVDPTAALADHPYAIPHQRVEYVARDTPVPVGYWRGHAHSQNPFARECFIDELAHRAGRDAYEYRRDLMARASASCSKPLPNAPAGPIRFPKDGGAVSPFMRATAAGSPKWSRHRWTSGACRACIA
jgi:CO/xanthine dehydrogenase Mo-binding subunit